MTLLDHKESLNGSYIEVVQEYSRPAPVVRDDPPPAVEPSATGFDVLKWAYIAAVVITTIIAIASFVLSFATLWDLATRAGLPAGLSWLWPVIVDGTILQATISVIALAPYERLRGARRFFWAVLGVAAVVSISSNALHAFISPSGALHPALAAGIATVAPVSLLAATHGIAVLSRARTPVPESIPEPVPAPVPASAPDEPPVSDESFVLDEFEAELESAEPPDWDEVAATMRIRGLTNRPSHEVAEILRGKFERDLSNRQIAKSIDVHHSTIGRVVAAAETVVSGGAHARS